MKVHIGSILKRVVFEKHVVKGDLARAMGLHVGSLSRIFREPAMSTEMLNKFSTVLKYDFFAHFSEELQMAAGKNGQTSCEKLLVESDAENGRMKQEIVYLKQINELLMGK